MEPDWLNVTYEKDLLNPEANSIDAIAALLAWTFFVCSGGRNDEGELVDEEGANNESDVMYYAAIPFVNDYFEKIPKNKHFDPKVAMFEGLVYPPKAILTRRKVNVLFSELDKNFDEDTWLIDFDQALAKLTNHGLRAMFFHIFAQVALADNHASNLEEMMNARIRDKFGYNEDLSYDDDEEGRVEMDAGEEALGVLGMFVLLAGIGNLDDSENGPFSQRVIEHNRKLTKSLESIEDSKMYMDAYKQAWKESFGSKYQDGGNSGLCFVATLCYGHGTDELNILRSYRDEVLSKNKIGRSFIKLYYNYGYYLAEFIGKSTSIKSYTKKLILGPIVKYAQRKISQKN